MSVSSAQFTKYGAYRKFRTGPAILELLKTRYEAFTSYQVAYFPTFQACKEWVEKTTGKPVLID